MPDESIEQTLSRLRAEHVRCECDFDGDESCTTCFECEAAWPCDTARLLEHIEGLQAALRAMAS